MNFMRDDWKVLQLLVVVVTSSICVSSLTEVLSAHTKAPVDQTIEERISTVRGYLIFCSQMQDSNDFFDVNLQDTSERKDDSPNLSQWSNWANFWSNWNNSWNNWNNYWNNWTDWYDWNDWYDWYDY